MTPTTERRVRSWASTTIAEVSLTVYVPQLKTMHTRPLPSIFPLRRWNSTNPWRMQTVTTITWTSSRTRSRLIPCAYLRFTAPTQLLKRWVAPLSKRARREPQDTLNRWLSISMPKTSESFSHWRRDRRDFLRMRAVSIEKGREGLCHQMLSSTRRSCLSWKKGWSSRETVKLIMKKSSRRWLKSWRFRLKYYQNTRIYLEILVVFLRPYLLLLRTKLIQLIK